jgi:PIN domain nuclease of toxin-antitoxin system
MKPPVYVVDACALIALINQEAGGDIVRDLLKNAESGGCHVKIHAVNLCEVYYDCLRIKNSKVADELLKTVETMPLETVALIENRLLKEVGAIKATQKVSLADAFAVGLAIISKAHLVTSDHHELEPLERSGIIQVLWIR